MASSSSVGAHRHGCEFVDKVPDYFCCKRCSLIARRRSTTTCCGESYCQPCITTVKENGGPCPGCGLLEFSATEQGSYQKSIESQRVYCSNKRRGCGWSGMLGQLESHLDPSRQGNCLCVGVPCPLKCKLVVPRGNLEAHISEQCVKRDYFCEHCSFKASYEEVVNVHLPECRHISQQCPNFSDGSCKQGHYREAKVQTQETQLQQQLTEKVLSLERRVQAQDRMLINQEKKCLEQERRANFKVMELERKLCEQEQKFEVVLKNCVAGQDQQIALLRQKVERNRISLGLNRTFFLENFSAEKAKNRVDKWKSPALYTHIGGYKFCVGVDANGCLGCRGRGLYVAAYAMCGEYDHQLSWPVTAKFTLELVNHTGGESAVAATEALQWKKPAKPFVFLSAFQRLVIAYCQTFLEHSKLEEFLCNNTLQFNISDVRVM